MKVIYKQHISSLLTTPGVNFYAEAPIDEKDIDISMARLCTSTAKGMLTRTKVYSATVLAFARSNYHSLSCILKEKDDYLAIDYSLKDVLRDFSKSTRIGEIAQGINYYIAQTELGAYAIYDFKQFIKDISIHAHISGRTPDYVMCYLDGSYGLLESKGTDERNPTSRILDAQKQINNGITIFKNTMHVDPRNTFDAVVSFGTTSKWLKRYTTAFLVDPENDNDLNIHIDYQSGLMHELSKTICLAGNIELANKFKNGYNGDSINDLMEMIGVNQKNDYYKIGEINYLDEEFTERKIEFGISAEIIDYLSERQPKKEIPVIDIGSDDNTEYYRDGTFIRVIN